MTHNYEPSEHCDESCHPRGVYRGAHCSTCGEPERSPMHDPKSAIGALLDWVREVHANPRPDYPPVSDPPAATLADEIAVRRRSHRDAGSDA